MRTCLDCIPCYIRQSLDACRMISSDQQLLGRVLKLVLQAVSEFDLDLSPPEIGQVVHRIIREQMNDPDPYLKLKDQSTQRALEICDQIQQRITESKNPFETAVRFAIAGNIMDFGMKTVWDEAHIMASFKKAQQQPLDTDQVDDLYKSVAQAKTVLVLGDNAGEAVFDRLLIENFPGDAEVIYAVKGSPVINDVTEHDAIAAGLDKVATILPNGADIQGTALKQCSEQFLACFNDADVVIAKGQGNFETLNTNSRKIYFLLQVKCAVIAEHYNYGLGDWLVTTWGPEKESEMNLCG
jgi:damage-control phosphatase, subfamily I